MKAVQPWRLRRSYSTRRHNSHMAVGMKGTLRVPHSEAARGRRSDPARAAEPAVPKKKFSASNAWREARSLVAARKGRLALGLVLMLIYRLVGLVLPATSKFL